MEGEGEEDHIDAGKQRHLPEIKSREKGEDHKQFENDGKPYEELRGRKARASDVVGGTIDISEFQAHSENEYACKDQSARKDRKSVPGLRHLIFPTQRKDPEL